MPPINPYDLKQLRHQAAITRRILKQYEAGVQVLIPTLSTINYKGKPFQLSDYPALQKKVDAMAAKLQNQIYATTVNGIKESWDISNQKNNLLVDKRLAGKKAKRSVKSVLYDPNKAALEAFISRKEKGVDLSQRIWNSVEPFKKEVEQAIGIGIGKGQSAASIAKDIKQYLKEPDKLFRRVRGEDGKLHLSAAARNYNPGQGVYRSSFKNAMRVARTETNGSYRTADYERWQKLPFVTGIRIQLSNAHPTRDICDSLVGIYPKDFKFQGWHPQCICFATPEMLSDAEYDKMEADILNGRPINPEEFGATRGTPKNFNEYLAVNKNVINAAANPPYWVKNNPDFTNPLLSGKVNTNRGRQQEVLDKTSFKVKDTFGALKKHGVTGTELLNLTGGIPSEKFNSFYINIEAVSEDVFSNRITSSIGDVIRRIDFRDKSIYNSLMELNEKGGGNGTNLFLNQVIQARKLGFKKLEVEAAGGSDWDFSDRWDGYHRWGRLGYKMKPAYQEQFQDLMEEFGYDAEDLGQLLLTAEGNSFWKENGFSWKGFFDLTDGSESMEYLKDYLRRKKINVDL